VDRSDRNYASLPYRLQMASTASDRTETRSPVPSSGRLHVQTAARAGRRQRDIVAVQFVITVMAWRFALEMGTATRKRWPSGVTSNAVQFPSGPAVNRVTGVPTRRVGCVCADTAIIRPSGVTYTISPLSRGHCIISAPEVDMRSFSPGPGKAVTYSSGRPVSSEMTAMYRPSGENRASLSVNGVSSRGDGAVPPWSGSVQRSNVPVPGRARYNRVSPSGETSVAI